MNVIDSGVMELLREQEKFEDEVAKRLSSLMDRVSNNVVKLLLHTLVFGLDEACKYNKGLIGSRSRYELIRIR